MSGNLNHIHIVNMVYYATKHDNKTVDTENKTPELVVYQEKSAYFFCLELQELKAWTYRCKLLSGFNSNM